VISQPAPGGKRARSRKGLGPLRAPEEKSGMDFPDYQLPEELQLLQQTVRRIVQEEIVPLERTMDPEATELDDANWQHLVTLNRNAGLWAMGAPKE
jgi:hypothetical protein